METCSNFCIDLWKSRLGMAILELKKPRGTSGNSRPNKLWKTVMGELEIEISGGAFAAVFKRAVFYS